MLSFRTWLVEARKKKVRRSEPQVPTSVSSPLRGANQDQSGFGVGHSTADYTISDEKKTNR